MFVADNTLLLIIDIQGKLADLVNNSDRVIKNAQILVKTANILQIPILYTEQVPEKIGLTIAPLKNLLPEDPIVKRTFSCCGEQHFVQRLESYQRDQIIVSGIETHICVYQTVYDLIQKSYDVKVIQDAVSSRKREDHQLALRQMEFIGSQLTTTEMIIYEIIKGSDNDHFKEIVSFLKEK